VNEGILIANADGKIIMANPKVYDMFGYTGDELNACEVEVLVPMPKRERHRDYRAGYVNHPVKRPMGKNLVLFGLRKDQSEFPIEISLSYFETESGLYVIAFVIDITLRHEQQERIRKMNDELKTLNETLERKVGERTLVLREALNELEKSRDELSDALDAEKELNEMKSRFISMASHEFRTPLSAIMSSVSLIGKYPEASDQDKRIKHIDRVKNAVIGLTQILDDFLSIGKLEEGKVHLHLNEGDVVAEAQRVMQEIQPICKSGQHIVWEGPKELFAWTDFSLIRNILFNLLSNAIKFSPEGRPIRLCIQPLSDRFRILVVDEGIGISKEDQEHLFERFFRAKNAFNIQGTGLGLHIVLKYLELLQGQITIESELNSGTTIQIEIPQQLKA
jgi:PAS domain S-box-containing protein